MLAFVFFEVPFNFFLNLSQGHRAPLDFLSITSLFGFFFSKNKFVRLSIIIKPGEKKGDSIIER
jgi:hypothetical protein